MDRKIKTKEYMLKKLVKNNRTKRNIHTLKTKDAEDTQGASAPFSSYAPEKIKRASEKTLRQAKRNAVQGVKTILSNKAGARNQAHRAAGARLIGKSNAAKYLQSAEKTPAYQRAAKLASVQISQRKQFLTLRNANKAAGINKFFVKLAQAVKNIIPVEWRVYIALIGGGIVLTVSLMVVIFGGIFGGGDGTTYGGAFAMPFDNAESVSVTDGYGWRIHPITGVRTFHYGIDFGTPHHCEIKATAIGEVIYADVYGSYGNTVILKHEIYGDVMYSMYAHLSEIRVTVSQMVMQGEVIGLEGGSADDPNPGTSTGHHLHYGMMNKRMEYVNPGDYLILD